MRLHIYQLSLLLLQQVKRYFRVQLGKNVCVPITCYQVFFFFVFFFGGAQKSVDASQTKREEGPPDRRVLCNKVLWYTMGCNDVEVQLSRLNYLLIVFLVTV